MSDIKDLWELGKAQGAHDERERIIELLDSEMLEREKMAYEDGYSQQFVLGLVHAKWLIKRDQK